MADGFEVDLYAFRERPQVEAIIGYLRAVGVKANLRYFQYPAMRDAVRAGKAAMVFQSWGSSSINDVSAATSVFYKGNPDDVNRDVEVQSLLQRGDTSAENTGIRLPRRPRSAHRTRSPVATSRKREFSKCPLETIDNFVPEMPKIGGWSSQKPAIGGHFCEYQRHVL